MRNFLPLLLATLLLGCAAEPTYRPAARGGHGYLETQLEGGRWRIDARGPRGTSQETLRRMALVRAAEIARDQGYAQLTVVSVYSAGTGRRLTENDGASRVEVSEGANRSIMTLPPTIQPEGIDPFARLVVQYYLPGERAPGNGVEPGAILAAYGPEMGMPAER